MTEKHIKHIQHQLRTVERAQRGDSTLAVDGNFGDATKSSLSRFQEGYGISPSGEANRETLKALEEAYLISRELVTSAIGIFPFTCEIIYKRGDFSPVVALLQIMINQISLQFENLNAVNPSGRFEEETEKAIKQLQSIGGLPQNGVIDRLTWNLVASIYNSLTKRCGEN